MSEEIRKAEELTEAEEISDDDMETVSGGAYKIYDVDTGALLGKYTWSKDAQKVIERYNDAGRSVRVEAGSLFDDKSIEGLYMAKKER